MRSIVIIILLVLMISSDSVAELSASSKNTISGFENGLKELSLKSSTAKEYYDFYLENKVLGRTYTDSTFQPAIEVLESSRTERWFVVAVTADSTDYSRFGPKNSLAIAKDRNVILKGYPASNILKGWILAHELDHVISYLYGKEELPEGAPKEARDLMFYAGEADAYSIELDIMDEYTGGRYVKALAEELPKADEIVAQTGQKPDELIIMDRWVDGDKIEGKISLPSPKSDLEKMMRATLYDIHGEFVRINMAAPFNSDSQAMLKVMYIKRLFEENGIKP